MFFQNWHLSIRHSFYSPTEDVIFDAHFFSQTRSFRRWTDQDALVHVAVLHVQADPDDAAVVDLLVVQRQRQSRVVWHRRHWAFVRAGGRQRGGAGDGGGGGTAGAGGRAGAGARARGVQRRQRGALPELSGRTGEEAVRIKHCVQIFYISMSLLDSLWNSVSAASKSAEILGHEMWSNYNV